MEKLVRVDRFDHPGNGPVWQSFYRLENGDILETRVLEGATADYYRRTHHHNSEVSWSLPH